MESLKVNPNPASLGLPSNEEQKKMGKKKEEKISSKLQGKRLLRMNAILKGEVKTLSSHTVGLYQDYLMKAQ